MSRPRFLADHDLNQHIIDGARRREPSIEIVCARDVGLADRPDPEVLQYAADHSFIVISHDVNTMPGHAKFRAESGQVIPGLLMVQQSASVNAIIDSLVLIWSASDTEEWTNVVAFLPI